MSLLVAIVALLPTRRRAKIIRRSFGTIFRNLVWDTATMLVLVNASGTNTYMAFLATFEARLSSRWRCVIVYIWAILRQLAARNAICHPEREYANWTTNSHARLDCMNSKPYLRSSGRRL
jgi:hypothetical protein